jgi:hypothetical protein
MVTLKTVTAGPGAVGLESRARFEELSQEYLYLNFIQEFSLEKPEMILVALRNSPEKIMDSSFN